MDHSFHFFRSFNIHENAEGKLYFSKIRTSVEGEYVDHLTTQMARMDFVCKG